MRELLIFGVGTFVGIALTLTWGLCMAASYADEQPEPSTEPHPWSVN